VARSVEAQHRLRYPRIDRLAARSVERCTAFRIRRAAP
jgi:hypothetical protein